MGVAYTTSTKVTAELPADLPASVTDNWTTWIDDASRIADSYLTNYTLPLKAAPNTPVQVERAVRYLVCDSALRKLGLLRYQDGQEGGSVVETYRKLGERILEKLRDGELVIPTAQL